MTGIAAEVDERLFDQVGRNWVRCTGICQRSTNFLEDRSYVYAMMDGTRLVSMQESDFGKEVGRDKINRWVTGRAYAGLARANRSAVINAP